MKKLVLFLMLFLLFPLVASAESFRVESNVSKTNLYPGDIVSIDVKIKDVTDFSKGINAYKATIDYDKDIFEVISQSSFESLGKWIEFDYNEDNNQLIAYTKSRVLDSSDVFRVKLKVKQDIEPTTTFVNFNDFTVSEGKMDVVSNSKTRLEIIKKREEKVEHYFIEGSNAVYDSKSEIDARFKISSDYNLFKDGGKVYIDNNFVDSKNYVSKSDGTTVISFKENYVRSLDIGKHELAIVLSTGDRLVTTFEIKNKFSEVYDKKEEAKKPTTAKTTSKTSAKTTKKAASNEKTTGKTTTTTTKTTTTKETTTKKRENKVFIEEVEKTNSRKRILSVIILFLIILIIIAILLLIRKKYLDEKYKNVDKTFLFMLFFFTITFCFNVKALIAKGDVNGDKLVNDADVNVIKRFIVGLRPLAEEFLENADLNSDGKITVTDLSLVLDLSESKKVYKVEIANVEINDNVSAIEKNENIVLKIYTDITYDAYVEKVKIDGSIYSVTKEDLYYTVTLPKINEPMSKTINIESVILDNNEEIEINYEKTFDVLKGFPTVRDYVYDSISSRKIAVSFYVDDFDNSFVGGNIQILDDENNIMLDESVDTGFNYLTYEPSKNATYKVNVSLRTNRHISTTEIETTEFVKEFTYEFDYKPSLTDINVYKSDDLNTPVTEASLDDDLVLSFNFTNFDNAEVDRFVVSDHIYQLTDTDNSYGVITVPFSNNLSVGNNTLVINRIILKNGFTIDINKEFTIKITPRRVYSESLLINEYSNILNITANVSDKDNISSSNVVKIMDYEGNNLLVKEIEANSNQIINLSTDNLITQKIIVEVYATYNGETVLLERQEKVANPRVKIVSSTINKELINKNEEVRIEYSIKTNTSDITALIIDNVEIGVNSSNVTINGYDGTISVNASGVSEAGLHEFLLSAIKVPGYTIDMNHTTSTYVRKTVPTITLNEIVDDRSGNDVLFKFNIADDDSAFISGKIAFYDENDTTYSNMLFSKNIMNTNVTQMSFSLEDNVKYRYAISVEYDSDPRTKGDKPENTSAETNYYGEYTLVRVYSLDISNLRFNSVDFEDIDSVPKSTNAYLLFDITHNLNNTPSSVMISGVSYKLNKHNSSYYVIIPGKSESNNYSYHFEKLVFVDGKTLDIDELMGRQIVEELYVLKSEPTVESLAYVTDNANNISGSFELIDTERALINSKLVVKNENDEVVYQKTDISLGVNNFAFTGEEAHEYTIYIYADYNQSNKESLKKLNQILKTETITLGDRKFELKDIKNVQLFKTNQANFDELVRVDVSDILSNYNDTYIAQVSFKDLQEFYTTIDNAYVADGTLKLDLSYDGLVQKYGDTVSDKLIITYGVINEGYVYNQSINTLITRMEEDPNGTITLTSDLDLSDVNSGSTIFPDTFMGTLDGGGYRIYNVSRPLFGTVSGVTIQNLIVEDAVISNGRGVLVNDLSSGLITNVHLKDVTVKTTSNESGSMVGTLRENSVIEKSSAVNVSLSGGNKRTGGLVGAMGKSQVNNAYVQGTMTCSNDGIGGISGSAENGSRITNVITKIQFNTTSGPGYNGGMIGHSMNLYLENALSLSDGGKVNRIYGTGMNGGSKNYYSFAESTLVQGNEITVNKNEINSDFYKTNLKLDEEIWNLEGASFDNLPLLRNDDPRGSEDASITLENGYIPNYKEIRKLPNYDSKREVAYSNMYKFMPYYESRFLVIDGNKINEDDKLNKYLIKSILAFDSNGKAVMGLTDAKKGDISYIKVVLENDQVLRYDVTYKTTINDLATYTISSLNIGYIYDKYMVDVNSNLFNEIKTDISSKTYAQLDALTDEEESRYFVDNFESAISNVDQYVINLMANNSDYNYFVDNNNIKRIIRNDLLENEEINKLLYSYNYFDRLYDIEIDGVNLRDIVYFDSRMFTNTMSSNVITNRLLSAGSNNRTSGSNVTFYNNYLKPYFKELSLPDFVAYYPRNFLKQDPNDWYKGYFKGIIDETDAVGDKSELIQYKIWDNLSRMSQSNMLLPLLTAPTENTYLISVPSQVVIGSLYLYSTDPSDPANRETLRTRVRNYSVDLGRYYGTSSNLVENAVNILNTHFVHMQFDSRFNFSNNIPNIPGGHQNAGETLEPTIRYIYEPVGAMAAANGSGAYANGTNVYWVAYNALGGLYVFSHETAHNQDGYYFLNGGGRRAGSGPEAHADGNLSQQTGDGSMQMNWYQNIAYTSDITNNFDFERIQTAYKVHSYYDGLFETSYVLDYLAAKAFLRLSDEEKAKVAVQASHTPDGRSMTTTYTKLTTEEIRDLNLRTVDDLWDNKIMVRGAGTAGSASYGTYGAESLWTFNWYQPHNDEGTPDDWSFKKLGFELLGVGGYNDGFVAYSSGYSANDLVALRTATHDDTMTWRRYKLERYKTIESKLSKIKYFDPTFVENQFLEAFKTDGINNNLNEITNVKKIYTHIVKRATRDFEKGGIYDNNLTSTPISSATDLINAVKNNVAGNYYLTQDIDFTGLEVEEGTNYYLERLIGILDGRNFKIRGLKYALFKDSNYAMFKDIVIDGNNYNPDATSLLSINSRRAVISNVTVQNMRIVLSFVKNKSDLYYEFADEIVPTVFEINNEQEFLAIADSDVGLRQSYILNTDLDFTFIEAQGSAFISPRFYGRFNGNNHKITGLDKPLFDTTENSIISNLIIENPVVTRGSAVLSQFMYSTTVDNVHINNAIMTANEDRVGVITGNLNSGSVIKNSSVVNFSITGGRRRTGGVAGTMTLSTIDNVYVSGTLNTTSGSGYGGVAGCAEMKSYITNVIANVTMRTGTTSPGGIVGETYGNETTGRVIIRNVLSLADGTNGGRINSGGLNVSSSNYYSLTTSALTKNDEIEVEPGSVNKAFFVDTLGLDETIWNIPDNASTTNLPKLKGMK